jgi:cell wall-associated NlpC family hydrolase
MTDFKNNTKDLNSAVGQFEAAFERAGTINMPARVNAAREYYKLYTGLDAPYVATDVQAADSSGETSSAEEVEESPLAKLMGLVGKIASAFTGAFSLSKDDGTKAVSTTDLTNSIGTGADAVANVGSYAFSEGNAPVDYMRSVLGKVAYSMTGPRDPEKGSADCSSTVRWAINKSTGLDIGGDTAAQYYNSNLTPVWYDNGKYLTHYPEGIQPNDVIFFTSTGSDKGAAYDHVGHVGLFEGNVADESNPYYDEEAAKKSDGKPVYRYIDHGDGMGPKEKELKYPQKKGGIIKISRLPASAVQQFNPKSKAGAKLKKSGAVGQSAAGSGLLSYSDFAKASRGSRGKLLRSRPGDSIYGNIKNAFSGAGSSIGGSSANLISYSNTLLSDTRSMLDNVATNATNRYRAGGISPALLTQLITAISAVLLAIANNTAPVQQIYELLAGYTSVSTKNQKAQLEAATAAAKEAAKNSEQDVSDSFMGLVGVLAEIARG